MNISEVKARARNEIEEETFREAVEREKKILWWPWYKRIFPFRIKIKVIDLRRETT